MIDNPLELDGGFGGLMCCKVRQSANVDGIQAAEASDEADAPKREIVARGESTIMPLPQSYGRVIWTPTASWIYSPTFQRTMQDTTTYYSYRLLREPGNSWRKQPRSPPSAAEKATREGACQV